MTSLTILKYESIPKPALEHSETQLQQLEVRLNSIIFLSFLLEEILRNMSQMGVLLQLACIVLLILGHGNSEDVRISVELSRRDDGKVGASLYVANATRELFKNSSIFLDFHAFTDQTHKLIAASGYVKDTNRNEAIELTCDATSKVEEVKECQLSKQREASVREEEIKNLKLLLEERMSAHIEEIRNLKLFHERQISAKVEEIENLKLIHEEEISAKGEEIMDLKLIHKEEISAKGEEIMDLKLFHEKEISVRDEEIKELRSSLPDKKDEVLLRIVSGDDKGLEKKFFRENRTQAADLLIVDGHSYTYFYEDMTKINPLEKQRCNFFVSDNGKVYEGIGWNKYNYYFNGGLGSKSLIIGFIKKDKDSSPSDAALNTFKKLVRRAICWNVLSPRYSVIPFHLIYESYAIDEQSFERNGMSEWVGYRNNLDFLIPSDEKVAQPIVSLYGWSDETPWEGLRYSSPIEYLGVWVSDERCYFRCGNYVKNFLKYIGIYIDFYLMNFFLAEDGRAYEVMGWDKTIITNFKLKKFASVIFMGSFHNSAPNKRIFDALEDLIEEGLRLGKLSPTFKIVSLKTFDPRESGVMGKYLEKEIRKHPRFSETM